MKLLQVVPQIYKFDTVKEFAEIFKLGKGDLVITNRFLYDRFLKDYKNTIQAVFQEEYGLGEPSDEMIDNIMKDLGCSKYDRVVAVGGGTVIDIAKLLRLKRPRKSIDLFQGTVPLVKEKKLVIIPTTCGTGSEVTNVSVAELKSEHIKKGIAGDELYADYAVLIPEIVRELPYKFFATSSIDALIHASESYLSPKASQYTEIFSVKAINLILKGYIQMLKKGKDYRKDIIEDFVLGSNYAGIAFGNAGCGAVHALSYPIGGNYHVPHGEANYLFFTEVLKTYDRRMPAGKIREFNGIVAEILSCSEKDVYDELERVLDDVMERKPLEEYGMKQEEIEGFAGDVIKGQQRLLANNYVPFSTEDIINIYRKLY